MSENQTVQIEEISTKKKLKIEAKEKIKQIKSQAKSDISDVKYKLFQGATKGKKGFSFFFKQHRHGMHKIP